MLNNNSHLWGFPVPHLSRYIVIDKAMVGIGENVPVSKGRFFIGTASMFCLIFFHGVHRYKELISPHFSQQVE